MQIVRQKSQEQYTFSITGVVDLSIFWYFKLEHRGPGAGSVEVRHLLSWIHLKDWS
jgi:hypothetical protein